MMEGGKESAYTRPPLVLYRSARVNVAANIDHRAAAAAAAVHDPREGERERKRVC